MAEIKTLLAQSWMDSMAIHDTCTWTQNNVLSNFWKTMWDTWQNHANIPTACSFSSPLFAYPHQPTSSPRVEDGAPHIDSIDVRLHARSILHSSHIPTSLPPHHMARLAHRTQIVSAFACMLVQFSTLRISPPAHLLTTW